MSFQTGPVISHHGPWYNLDWGIGTPQRIVGPAYVGRSFQPFSGGSVEPQYETRRDLARPWLPKSTVQVPVGYIDNIYSCTTSAWDNLPPDQPVCARTDPGIGHTNWKRWC
ncbi:hypothetical protein ISTM_10 [Insectomime virus]|nr:hypothetical protein ISTM_10 [Insectomime virus]